MCLGEVEGGKNPRSREQVVTEQGVWHARLELMQGWSLYSACLEQTNTACLSKMRCQPNGASSSTGSSSKQGCCAMPAQNMTNRTSSLMKKACEKQLGEEAGLTLAYSLRWKEGCSMASTLCRCLSLHTLLKSRRMLGGSDSTAWGGKPSCTQGRKG